MSSYTFATAAATAAFAARGARAAIVAARTAIAVAAAESAAATVTARTAIAIAAAESTAVATAAIAARSRGPRATRGRGQLLLRRRRKQRLAREADLAGVGLDADDLHFDLVADLEEVRHLADARVRHLGDVQQSVLTRKDLDERSVRLDALDRAFVVLADLRRGGEALDDLDGALGRLRVASRRS